MIGGADAEARLPPGVVRRQRDQGAEEQVLQSVDPSVFKMICVEVDNWRKQEEAKNTRVEELILRSGMVLANRTLNTIYLSKVYVRPDSGWGESRSRSQGHSGL